VKHELSEGDKLPALKKPSESQTSDMKGKLKSTVQSRETKSTTLNSIAQKHHPTSSQKAGEWSTSSYVPGPSWSQSYVSSPENYTYGSSNYYSREREREREREIQREREKEKERQEKKMKMEQELQ
jgi:hypothetical protein